MLDTYLNNKESFASLCALLVKEEFGDECAKWEFEVLWDSLNEKCEKPPLSDLAKAKIQSYLTMDSNPMVVWEMNVFHNTILASNNVYPIPSMVQESTPYELGWGVEEIGRYLHTIGKVNNTSDIKWGDEVTGYIAACLKINGWILAPGNLAFAQDALDSINRNIVLKTPVIREWGKIKDNPDLISINISKTNPIGIQLDRLRIFKVYFDSKVTIYEAHKELIS